VAVPLSILQGREPEQVAEEIDSGLTPWPPLRREASFAKADHCGEGVEERKETGAEGPRLLENLTPPGFTLPQF
jgi:hypothetical protein